MTYFNENDHNAVLYLSTDGTHGETVIQSTYRQMLDLHRGLYPRLKKHGLNLHPNSASIDVVSQMTGCTAFPTTALSLTYMRDPSDALVVEQIMGRDGVNSANHINSRLHPVIELRLTPEHFTVELIVPPDAWYDQQNLAGKLSIQQHRTHFYRLLCNIGEDYLMGFWSGIHVNDMHLRTAQLPPARILFEYMDTFAPGRDYLRIGRWYERGEDNLDENSIQSEMFQRVNELYTLYDFLLWTSNNNFHVFYKKAMAR